MAIEHIDGFDHWTTNTMTRHKGWVSGTNLNTQFAGRRGGTCLSVTSAATVYRKTATTDKFCIGCAMELDPGGGQTGYFFYFRDAANSVSQVGLFLNADGTISVRRGSTTLDTTVATTPLDEWFYLEFLVTIHASAGAYELRMNGATILSASGVNTQNGGVAQASQCWLTGSGGLGSNLNGSIDFDDFVLQSGSASALLGDCRVDTFFPDADGASSQFTPSTGTDNYAMVDEANPDDDTTYVESSTVGHIDLYGFPDLSHTPANIYAVQVSPRVNKTESGYRSMKAVVRSGGANYESAERVIGADTFVWVPLLFEEDPDTAAAWTIAGVNAIEAGLKVEA